MKKKWFNKAVSAHSPNTLGGWSKSQAATVRRRKAISSRPQNWGLDKRRLSAGRALTALANVTRDTNTERRAREDARYFFRKLKKME